MSNYNYPQDLLRIIAKMQEDINTLKRVQPSSTGFAMASSDAMVTMASNGFSSISAFKPDTQFLPLSMTGFDIPEGAEEFTDYMNGVFNIRHPSIRTRIAVQGDSQGTTGAFRLRDDLFGVMSPEIRYEGDEQMTLDVPGDFLFPFRGQNRSIYLQGRAVSGGLKVKYLQTVGE